MGDGCIVKKNITKIDLPTSLRSHLSSSLMGVFWEIAVHLLATHFRQQIIGPVQLHWAARHFDSSVHT